MPEYLFEHPETKEVKSIILRMNEPHVYEENGVQWIRIFSVPQASIDTKWNEFSSKDFAEKSGKRKGTLGDLEDKSKELSLKREKIMGVDPVKEQMFKDYEKKRGKGVEHPLKRKERLDKLKKEGLTLKF